MKTEYEQGQLSDLLEYHMEGAGYRDHKLATQVNGKFGEGFISRDSIRNWRTGVSKTVRNWRKLAAIAIVLKLNEAQASQLLQAGGRPSIRELERTENEEDRNRFLFPWIKEKEDGDHGNIKMALYYIKRIEEQKKRGFKDYIEFIHNRCEHIMYVLDKCFEGKKWQVVIDLVKAIDDYLNYKGRYTERCTANESGLKAAQVVGDLLCQCIFLDNLGRTWDVLEVHDEAIKLFNQALNISDKINNAVGRGQIKSRILDHRGSAYRHKGEIQKAIEDYIEAFTISSNKEINDLRGQERSSCSLGRIYIEIGQVKKAIKCIERSLDIVRESKDRCYELENRRRKSVDLGYLGNAYVAKWKLEKDNKALDKAKECYEAALEIAREVEDLRGEAKHLLGLGKVYDILGQREQAIECIEAARSIAQKIGDARLERDCRATGLISKYKIGSPSSAPADK